MPDTKVPRELEKVSLPPYMIETPDILLIDAIRVIPLPPYKIEPLDGLLIRADGVLPDEPIKDIFQVGPDGTVNLGLSYGSVRVVEMTIEEAQKAIREQLLKVLKPEGLSVQVSLAESRGRQQIQGDHLVRPDGTVGLGTYGSVYVAGMTLVQAKAAIESHLSKYLYKPEISLDVFAYNSKFYYVFTDLAGNGEQLVKLPATGNETVLDAVANINGLSQVSSRRIWIARPAPAGNCKDQILEVDWKGISRLGKTETNYQVLPGDRVYVLSQPLTKTFTYLDRFLQPLERAAGFTLLGTATVQQLKFFGAGGGLFGQGGGLGGGF
jgi:protein involved in polysaccharide export with SLBB domain